MKKHPYLAGLAAFVVACGGGDEEEESKRPAPPPNDTPNVRSADASGDPNAPPGGTGGGGQNPNGGNTDGVKFLVKKDDGLFYAAKQVSENPYSGKVEEMYPTGNRRSVKVYENGALKSFEEYFEGGGQKKLSIVYDERGQEQKREEWREDGSKVAAGSKLPRPDLAKLGRTVNWKKSSLNVYLNKPTSTVLTVFGGPDDRMIEQSATTYTEIWIYKNIKVIGDDRRTAPKTVKFQIENKIVSFVDVAMDNF